MPLPAPPTDDTSTSQVSAFASKIRTKYPGAYDDLDDESLARATLKKFPQYHDMLPKGFTMDPPTQFERDRTGDKPGFLSAVGSDIAGAVKGIAGVGVDPEQTVKAAKGVYQNLADIVPHEKEQKAAGRSLPYRAVAAVGQAIGVPTRSMEESAEKGDAGGVLGHAVVPSALAAAPLIGEGLGAVRDSMAERAIPANIEAGKSGILRVLKPKPGAGGAAADALEKSVHTAVDEGDLPKIFRETPLKGKGAAVMGDAIDKIDAYQERLWDEGHAAPIARRPQMPVDSTPVQSRALSVIDDAIERTSTPAQVAQARRWVANAFKPGLTLENADKMIRSLNNEIKEPPEAWGPVGARVRMEALKGLRDTIDDHLEQPYQGQPGEVGVRNVNTRWGALQAIKERLGERYWSEWQKSAGASPVPSWMRAYAFAHPGGASLVMGARLTGAMFNPDDPSVFSSAAKKLAGTRIEPRPTGQIGMVGRLPKGPTP